MRSTVYLVACAWVLCAGCDKAAANAAALTIRDDLGRDVALAGPAQRIVSLSPALTEVLFAVGCGSKLVMRDSWSDHPQAALRVPAMKGLRPSPEAIVAARPDLVLSSFPPAALRSALQAANVPMLAFSPTSFAGVASDLLRIGAACGEPQQAADVAGDFHTEMDAVAAAVQGRKRPRVFLEIDAGSDGRPYTLGRGAFGHELLQLAGGDNVFATASKAWFAVGVEAVLAADPDVILLADASASRGQTPAKVAARAGWHAIAAVRNERIHPVQADWISRPGPRLVLGLRQVAMLLHPEAFGPPPAAAAAAVGPDEVSAGRP